MKIAYFAEIFPSTSETWVHHEIAELIEMGCDVRVFATHARPSMAPELEKFAEITTYLPETEKSWIRVLQVLCSPTIIRNVLYGLVTDCKGIRNKAQVLRDLVYSGLLSKNLATYAPHFAIAHVGGTRANLALIWSLLSGAQLVIKFHAADVFHRVALLGLKVKHAAKLITISRFNIEFMRQHYLDVDVSRFELHKCGIPLEEYRFQPKYAAHNPLLILSVGRLFPMKGFDVLLHASKRLLEKGLSHKVKIYGDGPERMRLEQSIEAMSLRATVELMGYATPTEIHTALLGSDIFVLPSVFDPVHRTMDGIPVALMEAMAVGTPVISTNISGIPELIEDGVSGYLCVAGDSVSLSKAVLRCHGMNENELRQMLLTARAKIAMDHDVRELSTVLKGNLCECLRVGRMVRTTTE